MCVVMVGIGHDHHARPVEAEPGDRGGGGDVDVLRIEPRALAHRPVEHDVRRRERIEIDQRLGDRALPGRRVLAHRDGDAVEAADRGAAQDVERADAGRGQDQAPAVGLGRGQQAVEQRGVGEGADGGHEKVRAAFQHALAVSAHRLVPGAFGDGVEVVGEEAVGLVGQHGLSWRGRFTSTETSSMFSRPAASTCLPMAP